MALTRAKSKLKRSAQARLNKPEPVHKAPFIEHIHELRQRLFRVALSVIVFSAAAYFVQQHIVRLLLAPAADQQFAQTTPGGGFDFLFRICLYTGLIFSIPVVFHQIVKYAEPLIPKNATRFIRRISVVSWLFALAGIAFGYFVGLPAALHFLLHQFTNPQIQTLISIQSYLSFVIIYLAGAALLFQMPLVMLVINKVKPLKPSKLLSYERWVVLFAVVAGGILSPSPNIMDQVLLAGPIIATYQIGIVIVWIANRKGRRPRKVQRLIEQDELARQERLAQFAAARAALRASLLAPSRSLEMQPAGGSALDLKNASISEPQLRRAPTPLHVASRPRTRAAAAAVIRRPYATTGRIQL
jgi:sec-independent protein translocase protein TatC